MPGMAAILRAESDEFRASGELGPASGTEKRNPYIFD
jgi:hypothetical protein